MANELTRKGIAFGAAVALGSTLIVGGAANAAPNVNYQDLELTAADNGGNGVLATTSENNFGLVLSWNGDVNTQNLDDLKYDVSFADADTEDGTGYGWFGSTYAYYDDGGADEDDDNGDRVEGDYWSRPVSGEYIGWEAPHAGAAHTDTDDSYGIGYTGPVPAWDATSSIDHDNDGALSNWGAPYVDFGLNYTPDEKAVVTVQAYVDTNGNDVIDSTETHSAPVEVTFYNPAALTPVLALDNDGVVYSTLGEDSIGYEVTIAEALNDYWTEDQSEESLDAFYGDFFVESYVDGEYLDRDYLYFDWTGEDPNTLYDSGSIDYDVTDDLSESDGEIGSAITKVRAGIYNNETGETNYTAWQTVSVVEPRVDYTDNYVVEQDYVDADGEDSYARSDVDSLEYVVEFWHEDDTDVEVSGVDATVYVQAWDEYGNYDSEEDGSGNFGTKSDARAWLSDYGVEISDVEPELIEVTVSEDTDYYWEWAVDGTSDANGAITLDITAENPDADLYLYVTSVDYEGTGDELDGDLYWEDTDYEVTFESGIEDDEYYTAKVGESFDFTAFVVDQWGHAPQDDVRLEFNSEDRGGWDYKYFEVNSDGSVDISLTDGAPADGEETGTYYEITDVQVKDGSAWQSGDDEVIWSGDYELYIDWLTDEAVADYVTANWYYESGQAGISNGDFFSGNSLFADWDEDAYDAAIGDTGNCDYEYIEGNVHAENGYRIAGAEVTISGKGLFFDDTEFGESVATDSITVRTDENGLYGVYVSGHTVGEHTVTVTSGGKSTTAKLILDDRNLYAKNVAIAPFTGKAGTSEMITATVTDKWGNLVPDESVSFAVTGGGYFVDDADSTGGSYTDGSIEDLAEADYGKASEMLVILSNEVGYGSTVTATIDVVDPFGIEEDTTASASLAAGATDFGKPAFWTKDIGNGEIKLYAKNIVGAGKIQFFHNGKEVAWIKAVDALDPKLRSANGSYYLVRTVKLVSGKNVFEIKDDGQRVVRRVASK